MSWTMASIELHDDQIQIKDVDANELSVRGGHNYMYLSETI